MSEDELKWQSWVYNTMGDLFASAPLLRTIPKKDIVAKAVSFHLEHLTTSIDSFAGQIGITRQTLKRWAEGICKPSLHPLLLFCQALSVPPAQLLTVKLLRKEAPSETAILTKKALKRKVRFNYEKVHGELHRILKEDPPPAMKEVLKRVECCRTSLVEHFQDLYNRALNNYLEYKKKCRSDAEKKMQQVLQNALSEDPPPSVAEVVNRSNYMSETQVWRRFPALCRTVSARYATRPKQSLADLQKVLEKALYEYPPVPVAEIARRLECNKGRLYLSYPDLCHAISARYSEYSSWRRLEREEKFRNEVRQAALELSKKGIYPSVRNVSMSLRNSKSLMFSKVVQDVLRGVRAELGIQEKPLGYRRNLPKVDRELHM